MTRALTAPGYIYSAAKDDKKSIAFFEDQYLRFVDRYDDVLAVDPDLHEMGKLVGFAYFHALRYNWERFSRPESLPELVTLGDKGFEWKFVKGSLSSDSVIYGFGVGTNITFEQQLAAQIGATIYCFDPTPKAIAFGEKIASADTRIAFYPFGIFDEDSVIDFYIPHQEGVGSMSALNLSYSQESVKGEVKTLASTMELLGHDFVDLLKIDIEGAEHAVIDNITKGSHLPNQLCVEFDMPIPPWVVESTLRKLALANYILVEIWGFNCLFLQRDFLEQCRSCAALPSTGPHNDL